MSARKLEGAQREELSVGSDTEGAVEMALDHLLESGARRPALLLPDYGAAERASVRSLLSRPEAPDAVIGVYEDSGHHVLEVAGRAGLCVPQDLLVVCISENPQYERTDPPMSTVVQGAARIGRESVDLLLDTMHGRRSTRRQRLVAAELVVRQSSTPHEPEQ